MDENTITSTTLRYCYESWIAQATPEQIAHVDMIYALCEKNYEAGGDVIVECYEPSQLISMSFADICNRCDLWTEQLMNTRPGEDTDPQLEQHANNLQWQTNR